MRQVDQAAGTDRFARAGRRGGRRRDERPCRPSRPSLRIAANVFKESVRDKVLYSIVLFAVLIIAASLLLGQLTAGQEVKIIKDLGLAAISLFGHFIAIFIGIGLVSKEVERRSIYALLAKPMSRAEFVLGKFLGLLSTLSRERRRDDGGAGRGPRRLRRHAAGRSQGRVGSAGASTRPSASPPS